MYVKLLHKGQLQQSIAPSFEVRHLLTASRSTVFDFLFRLLLTLPILNAFSNSIKIDCAVNYVPVRTDVTF